MPRLVRADCDGNFTVAVFAELFKPQSNAFTTLWFGEDKVAEMEYWMKDIKEAGVDIQSAMRLDTGNILSFSH
jgi:hypothetical protein